MSQIDPNSHTTDYIQDLQDDETFVHTIAQRSSIWKKGYFILVAIAYIIIINTIINNKIMTKDTTDVESASESDDSESQYTYGDDSTVLSLRHTLANCDDRHEAKNHNAKNAYNNNANHNPHTRSQLAGAAIAGGVAGFCVGGPVVGAVAAGASALAVTSRSPPGKVARAGGQAVASVGSRASATLQKLDEQHQIRPRFQNATKTARAKFQAMDEKHQWSSNSKQAMSRIGDRLQQIDDKHHILDRASDGWCSKRFEPRPDLQPIPSYSTNGGTTNSIHTNDIIKEEESFEEFDEATRQETRRQLV
jgi:hypothetical protein